MSTLANQVNAGEIFAGRYRIDRLLGSGGMAIVYGATDLATKSEVAVKVLRGEAARHKDIRVRFMREADVLRGLSHPSIVAVQTFGETEDGRAFLVMERLRGETLRQHIRREGRLTLGQITPLLTQLCEALTVAHGHAIVHRDLKPANIFLMTDGDGIRAKVLDFGISKFYGLERITEAGEVLGTPRYMAPEQLTGEGDVDARADVYALGVILYEALAGASPFEAESPNELLVAVIRGTARPLGDVRRDLSQPVLRVVAQAMALNRAARFPTAQALAEAWQAAVTNEPTAVDLGPRPFTLPMGTLPPETDDEGDDPVVAFTPGTFRDLPAKDEAAAPEVRVVAPGRAPLTSALASTVPRRMTPRKGAPPAPLPVNDDSASSAGFQALPERRVGPVRFVIAAVVVAVTAAIVVFVLRALSRS